MSEEGKSNADIKIQVFNLWCAVGRFRKVSRPPPLLLNFELGSLTFSNGFSHNC